MKQHENVFSKFSMTCTKEFSGCLSFVSSKILAFLASWRFNNFLNRVAG
jgi:hypothetical protein